MWVTILRKPEYLGKSTDELLQIFEPRFICENRDLNVLKKDQSEVIFEQKDLFCYGQANRYTIGRITKSPTAISYFAYRADVPALPDDRREFVLKTLKSAPLEVGPADTAPAANPSAGAGAGSE
jgi:hypothetical protein